MRFLKTTLCSLTLVCLLQSSSLFADEKDKNLTKEDGKQIELKACGPSDKEVNYTHKTDKKSHPTPDPSQGKAIIYVIRPTMIGHDVQSKLAVDGDWKGENRGNTYFFFELEPGDHYFCSRSENHSSMKLTIEPNKTYFLQQHVQPGFFKASTWIEAIPEDKGREKLAKLNLSTWEVKAKGQ